MNLQMKLKNLWKRAGKYKFAALVLLLGMCLMLTPQKKKETNVTKEPLPETMLLAQRLEEILVHMRGVGQVKVLNH